MNLQSAGSLLPSFTSGWLTGHFARKAALAIALALPFSAALSDEGHNHSRPAGAAKLKTAAEIFRSDFTPLPADWSTLRPSKVTNMMREIERRANSTNPATPIVILDDDTINLRPTRNEETYRNRFYEVLNDRNVELRWYTKSDAFLNLGGLGGPLRRNPIATVIKSDTNADSQNPVDVGVVQTQVCLVVPQRADVSSRSLIENWLGSAGQNYQQAKIDPGPYAMMLRSVWHETWHCLDAEFFNDIKDLIKTTPLAIDRAHKIHLGEVYAETAALLTMAGMGYPHMAKDMADIRAVSSSWNGSKDMRGIRSTDDEYYNGVVYMLTRSQDMVTQHIQSVGVDAVSRYTIGDIKRIARDITMRGALNKDEFKLVAEYYARGDSVIRELRGQGSASVEKVDFLTDIKDRVIAARQRMLHDTGIPVNRKEAANEELHYDVLDILRDMPAAEKSEMKSIVLARIASAVASSKRPEQGVIDLIDEWRQTIHTSVDRKSDLERKLYILSMMLSYGELDRELGRQPAQSKPGLTAELAPLKEIEPIEIKESSIVKGVNVMPAASAAKLDLN